jgi:hypothetical protein
LTAAAANAYPWRSGGRRPAPDAGFTDPDQELTPMQFGILGLPKVGKTTLFNTLTASHEATGKFDAAGKTHVGVARVPDPRLVKLRELFSPKKFTPATVEYVDIPGIEKGGGAEQLDLDKLKTVDGLLHVVRAFDDPEIPPAGGKVDPEDLHRSGDAQSLRIHLHDPQAPFHNHSVPFVERLSLRGERRPAATVGLWLMPWVGSF